MSDEVATVIVNWNKKSDVLQLLGQLHRIMKSLNIFVVDNASTDDSVASIQAEFPSVHVIRNQVNEGGTGGFNAGLHQVISENKYHYVWLLDNDARVQENTLKEMITAMNSDPTIGIVGSRIVDINNRSVTVETGGKIRWDIMGTDPLNRNSTSGYRKIIDADYVAICSALVRTSALKRVGLMDKRFFIFWDDMDWGLCFKKYGYRVACATKSIVYHGSFTERDRGIQAEYYGIRNAFMVYTKHTRFVTRSKIFYRTLRHLSRIRSFLLVNQKNYEARLIQKALFDYLKNHWGKLVLELPAEKSSAYDAKTQIENKKCNYFETVLVSAINISKEASDILIKTSKRLFPNSQVTVLVQSDREAYYRLNDKILVDRKKTRRLGYLLAMYAKLKSKKFDVAMTMKPYPLLNAAKNVIWLNKDGKIELQTQTGWGCMVRLVVALFLAEIVALYLLPLMLLRSLKYGNRSN